MDESLVVKPRAVSAPFLPCFRVQLKAPLPCLTGLPHLGEFGGPSGPHFFSAFVLLFSFVFFLFVFFADAFFFVRTIVYNAQYFGAGQVVFFVSNPERRTDAVFLFRADGSMQRAQVLI
jgi:hypothetical protein